MRTIPVKTSSANYDVHVDTGLLPSLSQHLAKLATGRIFVLTSPPVWALWGRQFLASLDPQPTVLFLPPGESAKRLHQVDRLLEELAQAGADRSSLLVAFGGGIVGDLGGFLAAIYMRGIPCIQVPTTLLAQVDSSVGGKTGVNLAAGKNLAGAFHQPAAVFADVDLLRTLPPRELRAGLMECVKSAIIRDRSFFDLLETQSANLLSSHPDPQLLAEIVARSVAIKAEVVGQDEREGNIRMILNLGHTIGHAIESATRYQLLLHGEAIGWGMLVAFTIARSRNLITEDEHTRAASLVRTLGQLPPFQATAQTLLNAAARDKKNAGQTRRFVLPRGIGDAVIVEDLADADLLSATNHMLQEAALA